MPAVPISRDQLSIGGRRTGDERDLALAVLFRGGQSTPDRGEGSSDVFNLSGHGGGERERAKWGAGRGRGWQYLHKFATYPWAPIRTLECYIGRLLYGRLSDGSGDHAATSVHNTR